MIFLEGHFSFRQPSFLLEWWDDLSWNPLGPYLWRLVFKAREEQIADGRHDKEKPGSLEWSKG